MVQKKYLVHVDIIGFGPFLQLIAENMRLESEEVRKRFKITIEEKIEKLIQKNLPQQN